MTNETPVWALLDLRALTLHSYFAGADQDSSIPQIRSPQHTLHNFCTRYLLPITRDYNIPLNQIIAVSDAGKRYRLAIDPEYKATRTGSEPDVEQAIERSTLAIRELLHSLGIPQAHVTATEADDVIAYFVEKLPGKKMVFTVDADLIALSNADTTVFLKGEPKDRLTVSYDSGGQKAQFSVLPRHITLYKSIVGDSSDNIPGVKGLGKKSWVELEDQFGLDGLDELIEIVDQGNLNQLREIAAEVNSKHLNKISEQVDQWYKCWRLAKLNPSLVNRRQGKEFTMLQWNKRLPSRQRLQRLADSTMALWLVPDLEHLVPNQYLITASDWDENSLAEAKALFEQSRFISLDWETWNPYQEHFNQVADGYVDMLGQKISGAGITCGRNLEYTFYFQFDHADEENNLDKQHLLELLDAIPAGMPIIAQNAYFERTVFMSEFGYDMPDLHDTKIMSSHVDESKSSGLKDMSKIWLNYDQIRYDQVIAKGKTMKDYPGHHVFKYGADDPLVTGHLYDLFKIILLTEGTWEFVEKYEFTQTYVLSDSYLDGVSIDTEELARQHDEDRALYEANMAKIRELLAANTNDETIYQGASNWMQELAQDRMGDTRLLLNDVAQILKGVSHDASGMLPANVLDRLMEHRELMAAIPEAISPTTSLIEIETMLKWKLAVEFGCTVAELDQPVKPVDRAPLWAKSVSAATYQPYSETFSDAKFQWKLGHVNQLSEALGLPVWPAIDDPEAANAFVASLTITTEDQRMFVTDVLTCIGEPSAAKRNKLPAKKALADEYAKRMERKVTKSGSELNLDSPKQMCELFYAVLGLPIRMRVLDVPEGRKKRGLPGSPQANEDALLNAIAYGDATGWKKEVLDLLLQAKKAATRIKFFYTKLPIWVHPMDGNIHPSFNSVGTETRRPSGSSPNMLQLSKKGDGVKVRRGIVPNRKLGHDLVVSIDFDAQELRVISILSGDPKMIACYVGDNKISLHSLTASGMAGVSYEEFMKVEGDPKHPLHKVYAAIRKDAKNVNFGSAYGIGKEKLARKLLCPPDKAGEYLAAKKAVYARTEEWKAEVIASLHEYGYVETLYGSRKHVFNSLNSSDQGLVSYYERAAINFLVQGVCADVLKIVLSEMYRANTLKRHGASLIAPIYDEIAFSCHSSQVVSLITEVYGYMVRYLPGNNVIPLLANPSVGVNFADQIEVLKNADDPLTDEKIIAATYKALNPEPKAKAA